jgi:hypothetical protein
VSAPSPTTLVSRVILTAIAVVVAGAIVLSAPRAVTVSIAIAAAAGIAAVGSMKAIGHRRATGAHDAPTRAHASPPDETSTVAGPVNWGWGALTGVSVLLLLLALVAPVELGAVFGAIGVAGLFIVRIAAIHGRWAEPARIAGSSERASPAADRTSVDSGSRSRPRWRRGTHG